MNGRAGSPPVTSGAELVRGLQERTARALPARRIEVVDGWWLRHAPGCSWWVGTVLPHGDVPRGELVHRVVAAEEFSARCGAVARFQISPGACPDGLDTVLAERGYRCHSVMSLQVAPVGRVLDEVSPGPVRTRVDDHVTRDWFTGWCAVHGDGTDPWSEWDLLARVDRPSAYACALVGDAVAGVGRAVADAGWAGVFGMATLPHARGMGVARSVLAALARWARAHAADRLYLQVDGGNAPARRLYERAGFTQLCAYHYRVAPRG